ncbi:MAG: hypothetical protein HOP23_19155 [Methylococcaceae bacterium]|nr:hypothetical protein [Methylococcaceae bacterium]
MNRNHMFNKALNRAPMEINRKVAFHEAGHAAAIYLGNKRKKLPPVFFQIFITPLQGEFSGKSDHKSMANVEGGRLIHTLPSSIEEATSGFSSAHKQAYLRAFEADIINLLVGPLAEAKYIALRDGEIINPVLVNLNAIHNYGGTSDLASVNEYLNCFINQAERREEKAMELFLAAFNFVNDRLNWRAITTLAEHILADEKNIIEYDEIIVVLETGRRLPSVTRGIEYR